MRNLKRTLSLVLAALMLMGMMVVGAGAASYDDFTDADEITNVEAVMVMNALGILEGGDNGAFQPKSILTREQAAKIICYMLLGKDTAEKLNTNSVVFKDVAADRWSAPYIAYCVNMGILAGDGAGNFFPEGQLTGLAFAKMVLVALGKNATQEGYVGTEWAINVAVDATEMGLVPNGLILADPMTREQAAQMAFDGLFYTDKDANTKTVYTIKVTTDDDKSMAAVAGVSYDSFTEAYLMGQAADNGDTWTVEKTETTDATGSLASEIYKLSKSSTTDEFGRPATSYVSTKKDNKVDLVIADKADYTFAGTVTGKDLYSEVGSEVATKYTWTNYTDGANSNNNKPGKTSTAAFANSGNGTTTEVFVNTDDKTVTVSTINTYIGTVKKVTEADAGDARYVTLTDGKTFETENFAKNDVVLYTYSQKQVDSKDAGIQSMALAEVVTGNLEKVVTKSGTTTYTVDGTDYAVSAKGSTSLTAASLNKEVSFYVDAQGNIMKDKSAAETENSYIFVLGNAAAKDNDDYISGGSSKTVEVYGVLSDGTVKTLTADVSTDVTANEYKGKLFTYETDSNSGNLKLTEVTGATSASDIAVKGTSVTYNSNKTAILNSDTVFVFIETKSATNMTVENTVVKTGNANIGSKIDAGKAFVGAEDGVAEIVFVTSAYADSSTDSGDYAYVDHTTQETVITKVDGSNKTQYTYTAYTTEGKEITLTSDTTIGSDGVYKYNEDLTVGAVKTSVTGVVTAINGSSVTIGNTTLNLTDNTAETFLKDDVELLVGQTVTYVVGTDDAASDIVALWVTADQGTVTFALGTVSEGYKAETTTSDLIKGTGVKNTVEIKVTGDFTGKNTITISGAETPEYQLKEGEKVNGTITVTVTYTAPAANVTSNVTVA